MAVFDHIPPEATRQLFPGGPFAILDLEPGDDNIVAGALTFRSVHGRALDARRLPPALVSEAARDVLGALKAATPS